MPNMVNLTTRSRCSCPGLTLALSLLTTFNLTAQPAVRPPKQGAAMLKTDILGVFAHPDDETGVGAVLAYYSLGRTSVVANVYCTRGEGGGNMVGTQTGQPSELCAKRSCVTASRPSVSAIAISWINLTGLIPRACRPRWTVGEKNRLSKDLCAWCAFCVPRSSSR